MNIEEDLKKGDKIKVVKRIIENDLNGDEDFMGYQVGDILTISKDSERSIIHEAINEETENFLLFREEFEVITEQENKNIK